MNRDSIDAYLKDGRYYIPLIDTVTIFSDPDSAVVCLKDGKCYETPVKIKVPKYEPLGLSFEHPSFPDTAYSMEVENNNGSIISVRLDEYDAHYKLHNNLPFEQGSLLGWVSFPIRPMFWFEGAEGVDRLTMSWAIHAGCSYYYRDHLLISAQIGGLSYFSRDSMAIDQGPDWKSNFLGIQHGHQLGALGLKYGLQRTVLHQSFNTAPFWETRHHDGIGPHFTVDLRLWDAIFLTADYRYTMWYFTK